MSSDHVNVYYDNDGNKNSGNVAKVLYVSFSVFQQVNPTIDVA
ncbi:MAG: hypothetical protein ABIN25_10090 [Ginsengibacter sp.]